MMYEQLMNQISLNKKGRMLYQISHCAGHVSANARPRQLYWRDKENGDSCLMQETKPE